MSSNRSADALRKIPPTTLGVIGLCVSIHVCQTVLGWNLDLFTMCPRLVLFTHEYYRVFTSVFFHANLMHIGMNMLSTSAISSALEKKLGTTTLLFSIWWSIFLTAAIYMTIAYGAFVIFRYDAWMYQHCVGFSGIIFHLSVLESHLHPGPRSVFGCFSVPSSVYPWVLLLVLQLIMPNLSFLGHLAGILTGTLEYYGVLDVLFVTDHFLIQIESLPVMRKLTSLDSFVATNPGNRQRLRAESSSSSSSSLGRSIHQGFGIVWKFVRDVIETILVCLFGRNCRISTMNLRFWERFGRNNVELVGVIRPPEFYEGAFAENDRTLDEDEQEQERESLASALV